jgi:hypothetical protein
VTRSTKKSKGSERLKKSESINVSKAKKISEEESDNEKSPPYQPKKALKKGQHKVTPAKQERVRSFTAFGVPPEEIAEDLGISRATLYRHYASELREGLTYTKAKIGEKLYNIAIGYEYIEEEWDPKLGRAVEVKKKVPPNLTALIFMAKTRCGWKETQVVENVQKGNNVKIYLPDNGRGDNAKEEK